MRKSISWIVALALSASVAACGEEEAGGSCTVDPLAITPGTWCVTITDTENTCGSHASPPASYTATFTQAGTALHATSQYGAEYSGDVCGTSAELFGSTVDGVTASVHVTFADASAATGTTDWSRTGCSGTDTWTAAAGGCP